MEPDLWRLYRQMYLSRTFEQAVALLWQAGQISGEMHLGVGEEGIVAAVVDHLREGDGMALDHRGTPPLVMRGVDLVALLREFLGHPDGLCGGMGGHMHLFSPPHLSASSGVAGASGPASAGFGLAAQMLRPGTACVAFFGEGAMNQGMLLESLNLAVAWRLPVLFVCKDNGLAIATESPSVTGGALTDRARGFGMSATEVDGSDVVAAWAAAQEGLARVRAGEGPSFLHAHCVHLEGHFLGDPLLRSARPSLREALDMAGPLLKAILARKGADVRERIQGLTRITGLLRSATEEHSAQTNDPVARARLGLARDEARLEALEAEVEAAVQEAVAAATA